MTTAKSIVLRKRIDGLLTDLMARTDVHNVIMDNGRPLSVFLATALTQANITEYVDSRIDNILNVNPGILETLGELRKALEDKGDIVAQIVTDLENKATKADFDALEWALNAIGPAVNDLMNRLPSVETLTQNHNGRIATLEGAVQNLGDPSVIAGLSRVILGEDVPADLRDQDLFLQIVDSAE